ncbi:MAG: hypothetical protein CMI36_07250 [Owenweeksia sp.]|nr:hypothetical protein [Owenweeksia sp.]MBF98769.1 hypothetical protein [Owenweeksia sp.]HBF21444.1 hypothetical protein [Cryomorphaceae bacterium]|tara:strand:+ start:600 stop:1199 length:600 start_codon:yes stop_codon:yes gene_type:complete
MKMRFFSILPALAVTAALAMSCSKESPSQLSKKDAPGHELTWSERLGWEFIVPDERPSQGGGIPSNPPVFSSCHLKLGGCIFDGIHGTGSTTGTPVKAGLLSATELKFEFLSDITVDINELQEHLNEAYPNETYDAAEVADVIESSYYVSNDAVFESSDEILDEAGMDGSNVILLEGSYEINYDEAHPYGYTIIDVVIE